MLQDVYQETPSPGLGGVGQEPTLQEAYKGDRENVFKLFQEHFICSPGALQLRLGRGPESPRAGRVACWGFRGFLPNLLVLGLQACQGRALLPAELREFPRPCSSEPEERRSQPHTGPGWKLPSVSSPSMPLPLCFSLLSPAPSSLLCPLHTMADITNPSECMPD